MKQIYFVGLLIMLLVLPFILADTETYPVNKDISLPLSCTLNGAIPSNSTNFNISISYPNGTTFINNKQATSLGNGLFSYDINFPILGLYPVQTFCWDGSNTGSNPNDYYDITPNGLAQSTAQGIGSAMFLGLMIVLTFLFIWLGFKLGESDKLWVLGLFFIFLSILFIVYDVWLGYEYHRNFTGNVDSSTPEIIFYIFMFLLVSGLIISGVLLFTKWKKLVKYIKREIKDRDYSLEQDSIDREFE
jgi:hypothetical protein